MDENSPEENTEDSVEEIDDLMANIDGFFEEEESESESASLGEATTALDKEIDELLASIEGAPIVKKEKVDTDDDDDDDPFAGLDF